MQRPGWSGSRAAYDPGDRSKSISKFGRPFSGADKYSGRSRRTSGRALVWLFLCLSFGILLWLMSSRVGAYQRSYANLSHNQDEAIMFHQQVTALISRTEKERQAALAGLQPLFQDWQTAKDAAQTMSEKLGAAKADFRSLEELHDQRMEGGVANLEDGKALEKAYNAEFEKAKADFVEVTTAEQKARTKEADLRVQVELLRLAVQAFSAALVEFHDREDAQDLTPVKGALQPGNQFDRTLIIETFSKGLEGLNKKHSKRELEEIEVLDMDVKQTQQEHESESVDSAEKAAEAFGGGVTSKKGRSGGSRAMLPHIKGEDPRHRERAISLAHLSQEELALGGRRADFGAGDVLDPQDRPQWLSERWADRGDGIIGQHDVDDSLRCQRSKLCEGLESCKIGQSDALGCMKTTEKRLEAVREATSWSWEAYKQFAFGHDELMPLSKSYDTWFDLGLTLVDTLDTFLLLGMDAEYEAARKWAAFDLQLDPDKSVNLFETTIRIVGGLLAAFQLSHGDKTLLYKATSLALRLLPAFDSPTEIPFSDVNLRTHKADPPHWTSYSSLSEVTSLTLEMSYIARATGEAEPMQKAMQAMYKVLESDDRVDGLVPIYVDTKTAKLHSSVITLGARGDSYYEYLLKQWLLSGKKDDILLNGYIEAMQGVRKHMLMRTDHDGLLFVAELERGAQLTHSPKMDHLVCFLPGLLALGHYHGLNTALPGEPNDLAVAEDLMRTCYEMYRRTPTGLAPELAFFETTAARSSHSVQITTDNSGGGDFFIKPMDAHNLLRPETVESLFILKSVTEKSHYQEWAWEIFRAFHMHSFVETGGYANLDSCLQVPPPKRDKMESFWLAETLKYIYLTLDDSSPPLINLHEFVFNTEAHPLPVEGSHADIMLQDFYSADPYALLPNKTLDTRIQYWEDLAKAEAARQAQLGH